VACSSTMQCGSVSMIQLINHPYAVPVGVAGSCCRAPCPVHSCPEQLKPPHLMQPCKQAAFLPVQPAGLFQAL
jgi:hypothetical protein